MPVALRFVLVAGVSAGLLVTNVWWGLEYDRRPRPFLVSDIVLGLCFALAGTVAGRVRPRSRIGLLMVVLGLLMLLANPYGFDLSAQAPERELIHAWFEPLYWLQFAVAGHLFLSYPSGRLNRATPEWWLVAACYLLVAVTTGLLGLTARLDDDRPGPRQSLHLVVMLVWIGLAGLALGLLVLRRRRAPPRRRRHEQIALTAVVTAISLFAAVFIMTIVVAGGAGDESTALTLHTWMAWTGVIAVPVTFLIGLLRDGLAFASVGELVRRLEYVSADTVEAALAQTLRDPTLRVVFPVAEGFLDVSGHRYQPPEDGRCALTPLGDPPTAILIHEPMPPEDRPLLASAAAAAALALDNASLHAQVRAQLDQVRASCQRIATAADVERHRLERDLHDGAQQRLLGIGFKLAALRNHLDGTVDRSLVTDLETGVRGALADLRQFAQGVRPAVLTDQGLGPALAGLVRRTEVSVSLDATLDRRLDPTIEATAYQVVDEALRNAERYSQDARVHVGAVQRADWLILTVADDGPGGATLRPGRGLRALADRVGAVGGSFEIRSPSGVGTTLSVRLPSERIG